MMIGIASSMNYAKFDEVKDCPTSFHMWKKLTEIYGGDDDVKRAKVESLRGQFDHMKMREDDNIAKYVERIKASVSTIRAFGGKIEDTTIISKVLKNLLPIYEIRVSSIQEMRCDPSNQINLDSLVGRLTTFELDNYDNYVPISSNLESAFKAKLSLKKKATKSKGKNFGSEEEEDSFDSDLEAIETLLVKRFLKEKESIEERFL